LPELNQEFLEAKTAKEWGMTPREWREEPFDDRALMLAYELFCSTREAYQQEWQELKRKKAEKGSNPFDDMKRQMGL